MHEPYKASAYGDKGAWIVNRGNEITIATFLGPAGGKTAQQRAEDYASDRNNPNYDGPSGPPDGPP